VRIKPLLIKVKGVLILLIIVFINLNFPPATKLLCGVL